VTATDTVLVGIGKLQGQVSLKAPLASPTFTGTVTVPDNSFTIAKISASGTRDSTTFLRGDGTFAAAGGGSFSGGTLSTQLVLAAGTATAGTAPLEFQSGTLNTAAEAGAMEYDGNIFYASPKAAKRAIIPAEHYAVVKTATALASVTTVQSVFAAANDTILLEAGTTYWFEGVYMILSGTASHTTAMLFALQGGASITDVKYLAKSTSSSADALIVSSGANLTWRKKCTGIGSQVLNSANTAVETVIEFCGIWQHNAAGTGITPQIQFSAAPGGTNTVIVGSYIKFTPIGLNAATSVGPWS
jgi:hypothetical protein